MTNWRVTKDILQESQDKAKAMGPLKGSILKGKGNIAGFVGKAMLFKLLHESFPNIKYIGSGNIEIIVNNKPVKIAVRVKQRTVPPRDYFNCSVTEDSIGKEQFDFFAFAQVSEDLKEFWLLGFVSWDRFRKESHILKKGEHDGKFIVKESCWNIKIGDLDQTVTFPVE
jgi:hypothetical protein